MAETIAKLVIKKTSVALAEPPLALLEHGELAVNFNDGKLYYRNAANAIETIGIRNPASLVESQTFSGANAFTGVATFNSVAMNAIVLADGVIAWNAESGNLATVTLGEDSTLESIANATAGTFILRVIQDGTGGHTLTFGDDFKSVDGALVEIASAANSISIITILNNGDTDFYVLGQNNFLAFTP